MEAGGKEKWEEMLDRLSDCITRQEEGALRLATGNPGSPSHQTDLHNHVAALLVKHGITTLEHLQASFPGVISYPCNLRLLFCHVSGCAKAGTLMRESSLCVETC